MMRRNRYTTTPRSSRYPLSESRTEKQILTAVKCLKTVKSVMYSNPELFDGPYVGKHIAALMNALDDALMSG